MEQDIDKIKKLYIDQPSWAPPVNTDDFLVTIGKTQSNSVYHVIESNPKPYKERLTRYHLKVLKSDLQTALRRSASQQLIPMEWYPRNKRDSNMRQTTPLP